MCFSLDVYFFQPFAFSTIRLSTEDGKPRFGRPKVKQPSYARAEILQQVGGLIYSNEAEKDTTATTLLAVKISSFFNSIKYNPRRINTKKVSNSLRINSFSTNQIILQIDF